LRPRSPSPVSRKENQTSRSEDPHYHDNDNNNDNNDDDDDEASSDVQWEQEQLRKAGLASLRAPYHPHLKTTHPSADPSVSFQSVAALDASLTAHHAKITDRLDLSARVQMRHLSERTHVLTSIADMETSLELVARDFDVSQDMWDYVSTLCFCLRAKSKEMDLYENQWETNQAADQIAAHTTMVRQSRRIYEEDGISSFVSSGVPLCLTFCVDVHFSFSVSRDLDPIEFVLLYVFHVWYTLT
jgi:hypothetical protein